MLGNQPPLPPPPHRAGREFPGIYSSCAARVCTLCGWRTRARPECQLCPAHGSLCGIRKASGHRDHVSWCSLPAHMHTCTHSASLPQAARSLHTSTSNHTLPWAKTLTHIYSDYVLTPRGTHTHTFKRLSLHKRSKGTTKLSPMLTG